MAQVDPLSLYALLMHYHKKWHIHLLDSVINYAATKNIPGFLLFLDFEKAFDTLEWPFIEKT